VYEIQVSLIFTLPQTLKLWFVEEEVATIIPTELDLGY